MDSCECRPGRRHRLQLWLDEHRLPIQSSLEVYDDHGELVYCVVTPAEPFFTANELLDAHLLALDERGKQMRLFP